jgi:hypothetical protein
VVEGSGNAVPPIPGVTVPGVASPVGAVEGRVPGVTDPGVALPVAAVPDVDPAPDECCILHFARNLLFRSVSTQYFSHLA